MAEISGTGFNANLAPDAFGKWSRHFFKCESDFQSPDLFSPVPYFLLARAIELALKSIHLKSHDQLKIKMDYWHDLFKVFNELPNGVLSLNSSEVGLLSVVSDIYKSKGFEYFEPEDALTGFSRYPDLQGLRCLAKKIVEIAP